MRTVFSRILRGAFIFILSLSVLVSIVRPVVYAAMSPEQRNTLKADIKYFNTEELQDPCSPATGSGGSVAGTTALSKNIPEPWYSLIASAAPKYPDVDPRLVATVLWVENRSWPPFTSTGWSTSGAGAKGPFQFIASTWFGKSSSWDQYKNPSAYAPNGMGTDGDGDGIKDPNNPKDAVEAAFKHHRGSAGKPIAAGNLTGNPANDVNNVIFERKGTNLLYFAAKYNGRGAPNGVSLANFPTNENGNYVYMAFWLLDSDFDQAIMMPAKKVVDPKGLGKAITTGLGSATTQETTATATCDTASGTSGVVSTEGFSFPIGPQKKSGIASPPPCNQRTCHHDGSVAFDLFVAGAGDKTAGTPVYAISGGTIKLVRASYKGLQGCQSFQLVSNNGTPFQYWYGHISNVTVSNGQSVTAGQQVAVVGERRCTGNGSDPHLHIDRGCIQNGTPQPGGGDSCRDPGLVPLMNKLWEGLPE